MLSLVEILILAAAIFIRHRRKKTNKKFSREAFTLLTGFSGLLVAALFVINIAMIIVVVTNSKGYNLEQIEACKQENEELIQWSEEVKENLADNPKLVAYVDKKIEANIQKNML